jgi:prepilin-type N-terminal cleavage/methylation domain-containing protein
MRKGFSLIELSIGLVIIGLLTGGILAGQSLLRNAEVKTVISDYEKYKGAAIAFRQKYDALPGDFANAIATWGAAHATPATCVTTASTTVATCDGNENGIIDGWTTTSSNESYRFWQHLVNAGLIEGQFSGITQGSTTYSSTTANSPRGRLSNSLWFAWNWGTQSGHGSLFDGAYNNYLLLGVMAANNYPSAAVLKAEEAWNIDTKVDDGKPATGTMVTNATWGACTDAANSAALTANYLLNSSAVSCVVLFRNLWTKK